MVHGKAYTPSDGSNDRTRGQQRKSYGLAALVLPVAVGIEAVLQKMREMDLLFWYSGSCGLYLFRSDWWIYNDTYITATLYAQRYSGAHRGGGIGSGAMASMGRIRQVRLAFIFI